MKKIKSVDLEMFIESICRSEFYEDPRCFIKGVKVTLLALGYDKNWVLEDLTNFLWEFYDASK